MIIFDIDAWPNYNAKNELMWKDLLKRIIMSLHFTLFWTLRIFIKGTHHFRPFQKANFFEILECIDQTVIFDDVYSYPNKNEV